MAEINKQKQLWFGKVLDNKVYDSLLVPCHNLSSVLGDHEGLISARVSTIITSNLVIAFPGIVLLGTLEEGDYTPPIGEELLGKREFECEVSSRSYELYVSCGNSDPSLFSAEATEGRILGHISTLPPVLKTSLCAVYLDCCALYQECLSSSLENGLKTVARSDLYRMVSNCSYLCYMVERLHSVPYELLKTLRGLERTLSHMCTLEFLFRSTYVSKMSVLKEDYEYVEL